MDVLFCLLSHDITNLMDFPLRKQFSHCAKSLSSVPLSVPEVRFVKRLSLVSQKQSSFTCIYNSFEKGYSWDKDRNFVFFWRWFCWAGKFFLESMRLSTTSKKVKNGSQMCPNLLSFFFGFDFSASRKCIRTTCFCDVATVWRSFFCWASNINNS